MTTSGTSQLRSLDRFVIPTALGVVSSAVWWILTKSWVAAVVTITALVITAATVWQVLPFVQRVRRFDGSEITEIYENQAAADREIRNKAEDARNIDILTIRGLGIIGLNDSILRRQLFGGSNGRRRIRVLLLSPSGKYAPVRAAEVGESAEAFIHGINLAIQRMKELEALHLHDLEVYLYDRQPCWRIIALDTAYFVSVFGARVEGHRALMYRIDASKQSTFSSALSRMFEEMCVTGERII